MTALLTSEKAKNSVRDFHARTGFPVVVKYDGLANGKGVLIAHSFAEADAFLDDICHNRDAFIVSRIYRGFDRDE